MIRYFIKRPMAGGLVSLVVVILGVLALKVLPRQLYPAVLFPEFTVVAEYSSADAATMESLVTVPLEKELGRIDSLKRMHSLSEEGHTTLWMNFEKGSKSFEQLYSEIQQALDQASLPLGVQRPKVVQASTLEPLFAIVCYGEADAAQLQKMAHALKTQLEGLPGVRSVDAPGLQDPEWVVRVDSRKMIDRGFQLREVLEAVRTANQVSPGTVALTPDATIPVRIDQGFLHKTDLDGIILRSNRQGQQVHLNDIAESQEEIPTGSHILRMNGQPRVDLILTAQPSANVVALRQSVQNLLGDFRKSLPAGLRVDLTRDNAEEVSRRLAMLRGNVVWGAVLVIVVLIPMMNLRIILQLLWGIPFSVFGTFLLMRLSGLSLNIVSLVGLIIAIGMVVDGALMVADEIFHHQEAGVPWEEAVVLGAKDMFSEVVTTIVTTIMALAPLWFMKGYIGEMLADIPTVVSYVLIFSIAEAFLVLPAQLIWISRWNWVGAVEKKLAGLYRWVPLLSACVERISRKLIRWRLAVVLGLGLLCAGAVFVAKDMQFYWFSQSWLTEFYIKLKAPDDAGFERVDQEAQKIERFVSTWAPDEIVDFMTSISREDPQYAKIDIHLKPLNEQKRFSRKLMADLDKDLKRFSFFNEIVVDSNVGWGRSTPGVEWEVRANDFPMLTKVVQELMSRAKEIPGVQSVRTDLFGERKSLSVLSDKSQTAKAGILPDEISQTVQATFRGIWVTQLWNANVPINVILRLKSSSQDPETTLHETILSTAEGDYIPLLKVARISAALIPRWIRHEQGVRVASLYTELDGKTLSLGSFLEKLGPTVQSLRERYPECVIQTGEAEQEEDVTMDSFLWVSLVAFVLVFMMVGVLFQSVGETLLVFMTVVFGTVGGTLALWLHGQSWGFMAFLGLLALLGVVVDNAIVVVANAKAMERAGSSPEEAVSVSCARKVRPILLTVFTTFVGTLPMAYNWGGRDNILSPLGLVFSWGLLCSSLITFIGLPPCYMLLADVRRLARAVSKRGKKDEGPQA